MRPNVGFGIGVVFKIRYHATHRSTKQLITLVPITQSETMLTVTSFPSTISRSMVVSLPSQLCVCTSLPFSRVTMFWGVKEKHYSTTDRSYEWRCCWYPSPLAHCCVPAVRCCFIKRLVELELDFCCFERTEHF